MYGSNNRLYDPPVIRYEIDENIRIWHQGGGGDDQEDEPVAAGGGQACVQPTKDPNERWKRLLNDFLQKYGMNTNIFDLISQYGLGFMDFSIQDMMDKGLILPNTTVLRPNTQEEYDKLIQDINSGVYHTTTPGNKNTTRPETTTPVAFSTTTPIGSTTTTTPIGSTTTPFFKKETNKPKSKSGEEVKDTIQNIQVLQENGGNENPDAIVETTTTQSISNIPTTVPIAPLDQISPLDNTIPTTLAASSTPTTPRAPITPNMPRSTPSNKNHYSYIPDSSLAAIPAVQPLPYVQYSGLLNFGPNQSLPYSQPSNVKNYQPQPQPPIPYIPDFSPKYVPPAQPEPPVNCQYSWGSWSSCDQETGTKKRYAKTTNAIFGGTACDPAQAVDVSTCAVDCIGSYTSDYCTNGDYYHTYTVTKPSINENNSCKLNDGTYTVTFQAPKANQYSIRVDSCTDCQYKLAPIGCDQNTGFQKYSVVEYKPAVRKGKPCIYADGTVVTGIGQTFTSTNGADACPVDCCGTYIGTDSCTNNNYIRSYQVTKASIHKDGVCNINDGTYAIAFPAATTGNYNVRVDNCSDCTYGLTKTDCDPATGFNKYNVTTYNPAVRKGKACIYTDGTNITNIGQSFTSTAAADSCVIPCAGQYVVGTERCDNAGNLYRTYKVTTAPIHATSCSINDGTYQVNFPYANVDGNKKIELKVGTCAVNCQGSWGEWSSCTKTCGSGTKTRSFNVTVPAVNGGTACPAPETQVCNTQSCAVDCQGHEDSNWSSCDANCNGYQYKYYHIDQWPNSYGTSCPYGNNEISSKQGCNINCNFSNNVYTFNTVGTFKWRSPKTGNVKLFIVAGGGGGGSQIGGGGGGGGVIKQDYYVVKDQIYNVTVGAGGAGGAGPIIISGVPWNSNACTNINDLNGKKGGNSSFDQLVAYGGGGGFCGGMPVLITSNPNADGGSGGGGYLNDNGNHQINPGNGVSGQGNIGGKGNTGNFTAGGGGGAGSVGYDWGSGASGIIYNNIMYGAGGGGANCCGPGQNGGGDWSKNQNGNGAGNGGGDTYNGTSANANTGSGGGGGGNVRVFQTINGKNYYTVSGGNGGSGIVMISL